MRQNIVHASGPSLISFQGKVVNADGTNVTNGSYNFDFVMYDDVSLGTPSDGVHDKWHELTKSVTVTNGVFQTNLGSATALPDFNANPSLYLAVRFNADAAGYMSPRVQMASVPYALNADKVGGVSASSIVQLGATQSGNINISSGTITSGLINGQTISSSAIFTGSATLQGGSATLGTTAQAGSLVLFDGSGSTTVTLTASGVGTSYSLTLPTAVGSTSQCLQTDSVTATQLVFGSCAGGGGGDNITVNGSAATDANFIDTTASGTVAGTTFALNTAASPDTIALSISNASDTVAGVITTGAQTLAGDKNLTGNTSLGSTGTSTAASTTLIANTSDGTGTQLVVIGSTAKNTDIVTLQGGGAASTIVLQTAASGGIDIGVNNVASKVINIGSVGSTAQTSTLHLADSTGAVQTVTIGGTNTSSTTTIQAGTTGAINLSPAAGGDVVFSQRAGSNFQLTASAVPTADQLAITNAGQGVTTAGIEGLNINYVGGSAAVESSGARVDLTPGGTSGGIWSGLRIVANSTGPVTGVTEYGVKLEGPTSPGAGTETGIYIGTGWDTGLDIQSGVINLAGYTSGGNPADPAVPVAGNLKIYAKKVAGRMMLKWVAPSGVDTSLQPNLGFNTIQLWTPSLTATGAGFGTVWPAGTGTFLNVVPTAGMGTQLRRARFTNIVTTINQILGVTASTAAQIPSFWRGNAAGQGGFFMQTRFTTELVPAATIRLFIGLSSMTTGASAADTVTGSTVGLSHITTDNITTMAFLTRDNTTTTRATFTVPTIASGNAYDFTMYAAPNDSTIYYRLVDLLTGSVLVDSSTTTTLPLNTVFMGPQVQMSNGTANILVTTTAIAINKIYIESDN